MAADFAEQVHGGYAVLGRFFFWWWWWFLIARMNKLTEEDE
jgi:hypothetical protein